MSLLVGYSLLVLVALLTAAGHICFKRAAVASLPFHRKLIHPGFLAGAFLFVLGPVLSSLAARVVDFSMMYALTALNFIFILLFARIFLREIVDARKLAGVALILVGLMVMAGG